MTVARISFLRPVASLGFWFCVTFATVGSARAQNTGGVFGPKVTPGSEAIEWRVAFVPDEGDLDDRFASRFHYQRTVDDDLRLRVVLQGADLADDSADFAFAQFEAQWHFLDHEDNGWDSALRLDYQAASRNPDLIGLNWVSDVPLGAGLKLRGIILTGFQLGDDRDNGVFLQTRAALHYKLSDRLTAQIQTFNFYGSTAQDLSSDEQNHSVGPAVSGKLGNGWSFEASALIGVSGGAADLDFRFFLAKSF